jgi:Cu/Ag efflux protein CusF
MRTPPALVLALALCIGLQAAQAQTQLINGVVVRVDRPAKKIALRHGPIPKLDMDEGMTMVFAAPDPAMLVAVKAGDKVKFDAERVNGQLTLTRIEKVK